METGTAFNDPRKEKTVLLSTAYLPNIDYFKLLLSGALVTIEQCEHYTKQTYRNRCVIYSANGPLTLSIPLVKQHDKEFIKDKKICYKERWQNQHWKAITSAYKNSPYFGYFEDELKLFYETQFEFLFDYNQRLQESILKIVRKPVEISYTQTYSTKHPGTFDARDLIHPKKAALFQHRPYYQVFSEKWGFIPNLSMLDLLFHEGLNSLNYIHHV